MVTPPPQGPETLYRRPIQILIAIAPSWGRSDELHYFRKSCCLFDMLKGGYAHSDMHMFHF